MAFPSSRKRGLKERRTEAVLNQTPDPPNQADGTVVDENRSSIGRRTPAGQLPGPNLHIDFWMRPSFM
jgi:hypothetical protein